jgi:hypothetical protein
MRGNRYARSRQLQSDLLAHFIDGSGRADYDVTDVFNKAS